MRGADHQQRGMFSYLSAEKRVPKDHPLRAIRAMVDVAQAQARQRGDLPQHAAKEPPRENGSVPYPKLQMRRNV